MYTVFKITLFIIFVLICLGIGQDMARETKLQEEKEWEEAARVDTVAPIDGIGMPALGVRNDILSTLAVEDGDYTYIQVDNAGRVWAHCINPPETGRVRPKFESNFP